MDTGTGGLGNKSGDHPNYSIIKIGQNTEESPGDLRRVAVTQTPVRTHRLTLVLKTRKVVKKIMIINGSPILSRNSELVLTIRKITCYLVGLCNSGGPQNENIRNRKGRQIFKLCQIVKKAVEHAGDVDTNYWCTLNGSPRLG